MGHWITDNLKRYTKTLDRYAYSASEKIILDPEGELYGSSTDPDIHMAIFDVDLEVQAIPSKTPGHYHLYFDRRMSWRQYKKVMKAMAEAGLVDKQWVKMTIRRKQGMLRMPRLGSLKVRTEYGETELIYFSRREAERPKKSDPYLFGPY